MADLNAAVASLQTLKGSTVTREQLEQIQRSVNKLQRRIIGTEIGEQVNAGIDAQMRAMTDEMRAGMDQFRAQEQEFNKQMSQMGAQLGQTVEDNQQKIGNIIDDSLKTGKAKPVN